MNQFHLYRPLIISYANFSILLRIIREYSRKKVTIRKEEETLSFIKEGDVQASTSVIEKEVLCEYKDTQACCIWKKIRGT
jgi:hypothetical protein